MRARHRRECQVRAMRVDVCPGKVVLKHLPMDSHAALPSFLFIEALDAFVYTVQQCTGAAGVIGDVRERAIVGEVWTH